MNRPKVQGHLSLSLATPVCVSVLVFWGLFIHPNSSSYAQPLHKRSAFARPCLAHCVSVVSKQGWVYNYIRHNNFDIIKLQQKIDGCINFLYEMMLFYVFAGWVVYKMKTNWKHWRKQCRWWKQVFHCFFVVFSHCHLWIKITFKIALFLFITILHNIACVQCTTGIEETHILYLCSITIFTWQNQEASAAGRLGCTSVHSNSRLYFPAFHSITQGTKQPTLLQVMKFRLQKITIGGARKVRLPTLHSPPKFRRVNISEVVCAQYLNMNPLHRVIVKTTCAQWSNPSNTSPIHISLERSTPALIYR